MTYKVERKERVLHNAGTWRSRKDHSWHFPLFISMQLSAYDARNVMRIEASSASNSLPERVSYQGTLQLFGDITMGEALEDHGEPV